MASRAARAMVAATLAAAGVAAGAAEPSLRATAQAHLTAIEARDLDALLATVTSHEKLTLLFPDGSEFATRKQYVDFHEQWFADRAWHFHGEVVDVIETAQLGHVLARYTYESPGKDGKVEAKNTWLALTFAKEDGRWRLVFDQNTRIEPPPAK
jgi:ketosteroid isomerase-like protein